MQLHYDLDIDDLSVDPKLLACVSLSLARYYLALPLAREEDQVSVLMAYPNNQAALGVLQQRLGAEILPLGGQEAHVRRAIEQVYAADNSSATNGAQVRQVAWRGAAHSAGERMARRVGRLLRLPVQPLETLADAGQGALVVTNTLPALELPALLAQLSGPLLLVRDAAAASQQGLSRQLLPRRLLVVLRGYASDETVLEMVIPLARGNALNITVLALLSTSPRHTELATLLCQDGLAKEHMAACLHKLQDEGIAARLLLRPGDPLTQISDELAQHPYDLLVIAAEGQGLFVAQLLARLEQRPSFAEHAVLIVRPPNAL